jgi:hypothetical protein
VLRPYNEGTSTPLEARYYRRDEAMAKRRNVILTALLATALLALLLGTVSHEAVAEKRKFTPDGRDVVLIRCSTEGLHFTTTAYQGSTVAPDKRAENCPETISLLLKEGFTIFHTAHSDVDSDYLVYTMLR